MNLKLANSEPDGADGRAFRTKGHWDMSIASAALADASIAQLAADDLGKRPPPKRRITAVRDTAVAPEPR